jgi:hypothetical protein
LAETAITTNADLLTYDYATRADINRLAPHGDRSAWWVDRHTSGFRLVLDDLRVGYGVEEADLSTTTTLKRAAAAAAMKSALHIGGRGDDPESDDGKAAMRMHAEYTRQMNIIGPTVNGAEKIPRYRRTQTVVG